MRDARGASVTPKLVTYVSLAGATLVLGLLLGRLELLVLVLPLVTALVSGLALTTPPKVHAELVVDLTRLLERERLHATIELGSATVVEADVALSVPPGLREAGSASNLSLLLSPDKPRRVTFHLEAVRWGARRLGPVAARVWGPGRFVAFDRPLHDGLLINVYPAIDRLRKEITPPRTQVFSGNYVSRSSGDGLEFSDVREFVPGDTPRRVNWRVTSRRQRLHVDEFHLERNADIVLFLDTFTDVGVPGRTSLDLSVRAASGLANHYLARKDRVGLVAFGGLLGWLSAASGRAQMHRIVDYLIGVRATMSYASKDIEYLPRRSLPPLALVIAFSPLVDERALKAFVDLAARGYSLIVVDTLAEDAIVPGRSAEEVLAHRAWRLLRAAKRFELSRLGVPVVSWDGREGLDAMAAALPDLRRMPRGVRA